jgi:hypothetical protein
MRGGVLPPRPDALVRSGHPSSIEEGTFGCVFAYKKQSPSRCSVWGALSVSVRSVVRRSGHVVGQAALIAAASCVVGTGAGIVITVTNLRGGSQLPKHRTSGWSPWWAMTL